MSEVYGSMAGEARVSYGGDEFLFVELGEEMSLPVALRIQALARILESRHVPGIVDVCPSNASYMIRYDPDVVAPAALIAELEDVHGALPAGEHIRLDTEIIEIPVLYGDPWTHEVLMRFRNRHQSPEETDLEYTARANGFESVDEFIARHASAPFIVTFPCFVPGNAECVQLVPRERQIEAPKYLSPRTDTPGRALGVGGAFSTVYPAAGAGGYQLIGRSAVPVVDFQQRLADFAESFVLAKPATILKFQPVSQEEYFEIRTAVENATYRYRRSDVTFDVGEFLDEPDRVSSELTEALS